MENPACEPLRRALDEALSVGLGFGILGFNRLQVRRREWERKTGHMMATKGEMAKDLSTLVGSLRSMLTDRGRR